MEILFHIHNYMYNSIYYFDQRNSVQFHYLHSMMSDI